HTLYVGKVGQTDPAQMCQVNSSSPCAFNPTIQLVTKEQVLTTLDGFVWNDVNENGLRDIGEEHRQGWTVSLTNPDSEGPEQSVVTDVNGYYEFTELSQGYYAVTVETRDGVVYTTEQSLYRTVDDVNDPDAEIPIASNFGIKNNTSFKLTVETVGNGRISADGIDCGGDGGEEDCTEDYALNAEIQLTATADDGYIFSRWMTEDESCIFSNPTTVKMDAAKSRIAIFEYPPSFNLTVSIIGNGTISADGIDCGDYGGEEDCTEDYALNAEIQLTATADEGYSFSRWSGEDEGCTGYANPTTVKMDAAKSCTAIFEYPSR
ncbi:MAG: hypothetical protein GY749_38785, partial [Desulfobacteraceae bacterium]|nr:hypothetical protein [Desulfobacteraceae bacterium]